LGNNTLRKVLLLHLTVFMLVTTPEISQLNAEYNMKKIITNQIKVLRD
jgi:hypothetical protein